MIFPQNSDLIYQWVLLPISKIKIFNLAADTEKKEINVKK